MHFRGRSRFYGRRIGRRASTPNGSALGVPTKDTFNPDNDVFQKGKHQFKKQLRIGFNVLMHFGFTFLIDDADLHFSCVQIDPAVIFVLLVVESHNLASFRWWVL